MSDLLLVHISCTDRSNNRHDASLPIRECHEDVPPRPISPNSNVPDLFAGMSRIGIYGRRMHEEKLDLGDGNAVFLALFRIGGIPIEGVQASLHTAHASMCVYKCKYVAGDECVNDT